MTFYTGDYPLERHGFKPGKARKPAVPVYWVWERTGGNWFCTADSATEPGLLEARAAFWRARRGEGNVRISVTKPTA